MEGKNTTLIKVLRGLVRKIRASVIRLINDIRWVFASEVFFCDAAEALRKLSEIAPSPGTSALTHNCIGSSDFDLSIIIPAYNSEMWIQECMDSVLSQKTQYSYQVIAVNDGSTDHTASILDGYASDARVCVIHQENKGHSGARNTALKNIHSKYVMFVDSDDLLLPGAIETMLSAAFKNNADIVDGNGYRFDSNGRLGLIKPEDYKSTVWGGPCLKVIRSSLLERLEFPIGYLYEDTIINTLLVPMAEHVMIIPDEIYGYRIHGSSITQNHTAELNRVHSFWIMLQIHEDMEKLGLKKDYDSYCRTMRHIVFTYRRCILLPEDVKKMIFVCTKAFLRENYGEYLNIQDRYYKLSRSLQQYQYGKYCVLCGSMK
jgi:glycosyltransferase involved in cell wall biosynthesis